MAYLPPRCELFKPTTVLGWICCACGHFTAYKSRQCHNHNCDHWRCYKPIPETPREAPKKRPGRPPKKKHAKRSKSLERSIRS